MYLDYWKFKEKPFNNTIDPKFMYYSSHHQEALSRLYYTVRDRKGIGVLTGELGSGKTLLRQVLFNRVINDGHYKAIQIANPSLNCGEFIEEILFQIEGEQLTFEKNSQLLRRFEETLTSLYEHGLHLVLIVDEAQMIKDMEVFDQFRLFYNYQMNKTFLMTLIIVGQPELGEQINKLPAFKQRIGLSYHLPALSFEEVVNYIRHRCAVAGRQDMPFSEDSLKQVFLHSKGIPRKINLICDLSLLQASHLEKVHVDQESVEDIVKSMEYV